MVLFKRKPRRGYYKNAGVLNRAKKKRISDNLNRNDWNIIISLLLWMISVWSCDAALETRRLSRWFTVWSKCCRLVMQQWQGKWDGRIMSQNEKKKITLSLFHSFPILSSHLSSAFFSVYHDHNGTRFLAADNFGNFPLL